MLSIIVVNFKNPALLRLCLKSLERTIKKDFLHEIIVVDIASTIETRNVVTEEFTKTKLITFKENIGYTKGVNAGIKASSGDYFLILNPDVVPLENSIEKLLEYLKQKEDIGLIGPQLLNFDGTPQDSCFRFYTPFTILSRRSFFGRLPFTKRTVDRFLMKEEDKTKILQPDWLMGSAVMASKKAVDKVGLMDENFFLYMSDVDWARRFWENGFSVVYYPFVQMYHYHQRGSKGKLGILDGLFKKETRWHIKDAFKYFKKYGVRTPIKNQTWKMSAEKSSL